MTGTDLREALHAIADTTDVPPRDQLAFQRLVRRERRTRLGVRAAVVGAAAALLVGATAVVPFLRDAEVAGLAPAVPSPPVGAVNLETPVYFVADGALTAIDPQGRVHDLGVRAEEVIGYTSEFVYAVGDDSHVLRFDATTSREGPGGWRFERVDAGVRGPVQSAQLSADGRWLGWVDLEERLHTIDLKAGTTADPVQLRGSGYLVDLAQGTGTPLVTDDRGLVLLRPGRPQVVGGGDTWSATASRDRLAVPRGASTVVYDTADGVVHAFDEVPGVGRLSPYGDLIASVSTDDGDEGSTVLLSVPGGVPHELVVPGRPDAVAWADDDTVLVTTWLDGAVTVFGCEATDADGACAPLDVGTQEGITLAR